MVHSTVAIGRPESSSAPRRLRNQSDEPPRWAGCGSPPETIARRQKAELVPRSWSVTRGEWVGLPAARPEDRCASPREAFQMQDPQWLNAARHVAICGLQWGDEGKGKLVDRLAAGFDVVVRYNGGANAGHTVVADGVKHALHLVPCGILHPGTLNVIGNGVVLDPASLAAEIIELRAAGVDVGDRLRISDRAHLVMPYHRVEDGLLEAAVATSSNEAQLGTTRRGIGPCYADKALRSTALRVSDLADHTELSRKLEHIVAVKNATLGALSAMVGVPWETLRADAILEDTLAAAAGLMPFVADTAALLAEARDDGRRILLEGANAALLDVDHGTYPFVTSSNAASSGIYTGTGLPGGFVDEVVGVVKAYQTRVGAGPMPTELHDETGARMRKRGNEYGTTTGRPRRCGWLDLVALEHAIRISGATRIALMLLDVLAGFDELKVCTAYRSDGRTIKRLPASAAGLAAAEPLYETLPGFSEEIVDCRSLDALPMNARLYVQAISEYIGIPISVISVGPDRNATIMLD